MENKVYSMMGIARKAGKLQVGEDSCSNSIKAQKCFLVVVSKDASDNTVKKFMNMSKYRDIPFRIFGSREEMGKACGKEGRVVFSITDEGLALRVKELIDSAVPTTGGEFIVEEESL